MMYINWNQYQDPNQDQAPIFIGRECLFMLD